nr:hypothetical protein [Tanacetum cinerariifolium]
MEMKKIIMVVLQAAAEGAHFNARVAQFNAGGEHPKGCVRLKNACNLASCNRSCKDAVGGICKSKDVCCRWAETTSKYIHFSKMEMKKIIIVVLVVLQAAAEGAHFNAGGAHFNAGGEHPKGCVILKNACNLASCNMSCKDAGGGIAYLTMSVVAGPAAGGALFNAGVAHFNAGGKHPKRCVRLMNACNLASYKRSCEDTGGGIYISKDLCCCWIETTSKYFRFPKMEMKKIIMVVLVVLQAAAEGAHFSAEGKHPKGCVRLKNACNLAICNMSCEDAGGGICISNEMQKLIMVVLVVLQAVAEGAHFNAGGAHFNARWGHPKGCVKLKNSCNIASCNRSCEFAGGGICISKDVCRCWA